MLDSEECQQNTTNTHIRSSISARITAATSLVSTTYRVQNNEDITLIWYNSSAERHEMETMEDLREINDYIVFYTDREKCINYIASIKNEKILLIITFEEDTFVLLQQVCKFCSIHSIFIFCLKPLKICYQHILLDEYRTQVVGIFCRRDKLIDSIRAAIKRVNCSLQTFSLYDQHCEKSTRDLTKEFADFLWFKLFKNVVLQMPKNTYAKQQLINFCRSYYHENKKQLEVIDSFEQTYPQTITAIQWYTKQSFVYKLVNKILRTEDIELLHTFRYFISDLSSNLAVEYYQNIIAQQETSQIPLVLYRGCQLSYNEFQRIQQNIGNLFSINGFLSTSRSKDVSLMYSGVCSNELYAVLFDIECNLNELNNAVIMVDVKTYSIYPDEEEVLFDLGTTFKIVSVEEDIDLKVWLIKMKATDDGVRLTKEYIELNRKENNENSAIITFGNLLISMGKFDHAQRYFETILSSNIQEEEEEDIAQVYTSLGTIYHEKGELEKAYENYQLAYKLMMDLGFINTSNLSKLLNNIGSYMYQTEQYDRALEYYSQALDIDKRLHGDESLQVANILLNIGLIYSEKEDLKSALDYYEKALEIQGKVLPNDHIYIATSLNNIGTIFQRLNKYDLAFKYHEQALRMRQKLLPVEHDDIAVSFHNIAEVFHDQGQLNEALEYYMEAIKIREKIFNNLNEHAHFAMTLHQIGTAYENLNNYAQAIEYYQRALGKMPSNDVTKISKLNNDITRIKSQITY
ncbi:unnamed protein product [Adineta steineri]|uniref:NAD(P)(+)--arginine ADP-ribosyltransferase n=1 Tax=Adineta steineri TaxID=433720 RepID=A0A819A941_9BILA|nr:unnamed protein product [Adineta steineri]CAF1312570.1 unnamed protein product [Adineta steineri]CAF3780503.1 unnamed protein product [Adineta steineri]CAF4057274.1 unnamed protein product [Adineta steineri]